jgi:hypothetical protein
LRFSRRCCWRSSSAGWDGGGWPSLREIDAKRFPAISRLAGIVGLYVIGICLINLIAVVLQCGLGECHTFGYKLLQ